MVSNFIYYKQSPFLLITSIIPSRGQRQITPLLSLASIFRFI